MMGLSNHRTISDHTMVFRNWLVRINGKLWRGRSFTPPEDDYFDQQLMTADDEGMLPQAPPKSKGTRSSREPGSGLKH